MKRWMIKAGSTSIDDLLCEEVDLPEPGPGEVRIKVHAVSLNRRDQILLEGQFGPSPVDFVAGSDGAGTIDALGEGVDGLSLGMPVTPFYYPSWNDGAPAPDQGWGLGSPEDDGVLAEYAVLPASRLARAPRNLSFAEASCLPCAALTAWSALNGDRPYRRPLRARDRVLVLGTGSVSLFATQFATAIGAEVVATTSVDDKIDRMMQLGARGVVNYAENENWGEIAADRFGPFDKIVNAAGSASLDQSIVALAQGGEIALMGLFDHAGEAPQFVNLMMKGGSIRGTSVGSARAFNDMVEFIDTHDIHPIIDRKFSLAEARKAYEAMSIPDMFGKLVIEIG